MTSTKKIKKPAAKKSVAKTKTKTKTKVQTDAEKIAALNAERGKLAAEANALTHPYYTLHAAYQSATAPVRAEIAKAEEAAYTDYKAAMTMLRRGYDDRLRILRETAKTKMAAAAPTEKAAMDANVGARDVLNKKCRAINDEIAKLRNVGKSMPEKGAFTFYKKAVSLDHKRYCIIKLKAPANAQRYQSVDDGFKLRVSEAKVVSITHRDKGTVVEGAKSYHYPDYKYKKGDVAKPEKPFSTDHKACASGIHGFMLEQDAKNY